MVFSNETNECVVNKNSFGEVVKRRRRVMNKPIENFIQVEGGLVNIDHIVEIYKTENGVFVSLSKGGGIQDGRDFWKFVEEELGRSFLEGKKKSE